MGVRSGVPECTSHYPNTKNKQRSHVISRAKTPDFFPIFTNDKSALKLGLS